MLEGYDRFARIDMRTAHGVLDIFTSQARYGMLFGNRLLCLVQTDDPRQSFEPVGAERISWNDTRSSSILLEAYSPLAAK